MDPGSATRKVRGVPTTEPAFGLPAIWITESQKEDAELAGYTVVEQPAVLATHLTETIKRHAHEILSRQNVRSLLDNLKETNATVVDELTPAVMNVGEVHRVLQNLLREKVSIRDLQIILETLSSTAPRNKNIEVLTEFVRNALAPRICETYKNNDGIIPVITFDPHLEARLESALQESDGAFRLALPPAEIGRILASLKARIEKVKATGDIPIVICSQAIRCAFKRLTEGSYRDLVVLSYNEIVPGIEIKSLGMIGAE